jgi:hypothetical protein
LVVVVLVVFGFNAFASDWYVLPSGQTYNGDGTGPDPAASEGGAGAWDGFSNIVWDGAGVVAGDSLYLISGETYTNEQMTVGASGSSGNPITITVNGSGTATISLTSGLNFIDSNGKSYITVDGVRGDVLNDATTYGFYVTISNTQGRCFYNNDSSSNIIVKHINCYGTVTSGSNGNSDAAFYNHNATDSEFSYLWVHGPDEAAEANRFDKSCFYQLSSSGGTGYLSGAYVHHCKCEQLKQDGIDVGPNSTVDNNELYDVYSGGAHSDPIVVQNGGYAQVSNNFIHGEYSQGIYIDNTGAETKTDFLIFNNVIKGHGTTTATMFFLHPENGDIDDAKVYNNTLYNTPALYAFRAASGSGSVTNLVIKNNIFELSGSGEEVILKSGTTFADNDAFDYNTYMVASGDIVDWAGTKYTLVELQALSPARETNGQYGSPLFVNEANDNVHLADGDTVAIDNAATLSEFSTDRDGENRPQGASWDMGAYEWVDSGEPDPPAGGYSRIRLRN